jgi:hypothetical protein
MHRRSMPFWFGMLLIAAGCGVTYTDPEAPRPRLAAPSTASPLPPTLTVGSAVDRLPGEDTPERDEQLQRLRDQKEQMAGDLQYLESALDHASQDDPEAPAVLGETLDLFRERELVAKVRYSRSTITRWQPSGAALLEESIEGDLEELLAILGRAR